MDNNYNAVTVTVLIVCVNEITCCPICSQITLRRHATGFEIVRESGTPDLADLSEPIKSWMPFMSKRSTDMAYQGALIYCRKMLSIHRSFGAI